MSSISSNSVVENLLFWTMGYGGWLGVALLPHVWSLPAPASRGIKLLMTVLIPSVTATLLTGFFYAFYTVAYVTYYMSSIMIHPVFLRSCVGSVCLALGSIGFFLQNKPEKTESEKTEESEAEDSEVEESEETESEETEAEESEETETEETETETEAETETETEVDESKKVNLEPLRNAPPLPE